MTDVAVIVLTFNEEENIAQALRSVAGWARQVFVFDSLSTDATAEIARSFGAAVVEHPFANYSAQRNAALDTLPITAEWIFVLDADEWLTEELKHEVAATITAKPVENVFLVKRRLIWMGRWIRRGIYPNWNPRMFRFGTARYDAREVNEHLDVRGATGSLRHDFIHEDRKPIGDWIAKHNRYSTMEARELLRDDRHGQLKPQLFGRQHERVRWMRVNVWERMPPLLRPLFYFAYRYFARGGVLDGRAGFAFHFLHALWFPMLIDIKYLEMRLRAHPNR